MGMVIIALLPALAGGVYFFGPRVLAVAAVSIVTAVASEFVFRKALRRETHIKDLSAVVTGLLLALILPPSSPCGWQPLERRAPSLWPRSYLADWAATSPTRLL